MDFTSDVLFIGFVIRPEWDLSDSLDPARIEVEQIASHHLRQHPRYQRVADDLCETIKQKIAFPHIYTYHQRLRSVTPGCGYAVDAATRRIRDNEVRLAAGVNPPQGVDQTRGIVSTGKSNCLLVLTLLLTPVSSYRGPSGYPASINASCCFEQRRPYT